MIGTLERKRFALDREREHDCTISHIISVLSFNKAHKIRQFCTYTFQMRKKRRVAEIFSDISAYATIEGFCAFQANFPSFADNLQV